ncbi:MAG: thiamine pyrophosphate-binding protein [Brevefilum fermentans]|jgi:3D-(3,5/4)-trihydroxycyclohexane-1,2-dione acylhydrolase (decyclizing)|uniref:Thiamine pyrophosphate enzyme, central domain family n=1 Tax=Candidatus Brevifilum fermentans TaxID=1986204 RepID=A0A1Y6K3S1_9CHLR|nr:thiamine pyrophosphate-dependent enzyme [Brevefilum fermentans]SMX54206.1 Thiamine pyrophosphate enzyme, central domain family [Brevefilum fermentans]
MNNKPSHEELTLQRVDHAAKFAANNLPARLSLTLSEALIIGLLRQGVRTYFTVLGHGSTEIGEVLRIYQDAGLLRTFGVRSEIEASHAASALRWVTGEKAAVLTSIGPGALHALAASLVPASDGIGVWYLFGDETTEDEGFNMQQVPKHEQHLFLQLAATMGHAYSLHTPLALSTALQRGAVTVDHPYRPGPFYLLLPMNTQASWLENFNLSELPEAQTILLGASAGDYAQAVKWISQAERVIVKVGGGGRYAGTELITLLERSGGVLVHTPNASGCIPYDHPQNMTVGGSKGSLPGNYAMENADLLIAVGTRAVCQSDSSRTGYPRVKRVININADVNDASHYRDTLALIGDVQHTLARLNIALEGASAVNQTWLQVCAEKKAEWQAFKDARMHTPVLLDEYWNSPVLTQPAAIKIACDWAKNNGVIRFFDAGDVQANGFQIVEDDHPGQTFTDTGASYMGFAVSALLATAVTNKPFFGLALTGDGSFSMNPQILIDGAEHGANGCILLLDNGRMGAITALQNDQYGQEFATWNTIHVDYVAWARSVPGVLALDGGRTPEDLQSALQQAGEHSGLSLIHVPVYFGPDPLGGMGVYGRWNVGNQCDDVQELRHEIGL